MERCRWCRAPLDAVEYIEADLFGMEIRVIITFCDTCGWRERTTSKALPVPV
jgi:C4-type Zn-finger protein